MRAHHLSTAWSLQTRRTASFAIGAGISLLIGPGLAATAQAQTYVFNDGGAQVLPTGNWDVVYNMGPGTLVVNDGSNIGSILNLGGGTLDIHGSVFTNDSWSDGSVRNDKGTVDIYGGTFQTVRDTSTLHYYGGSIATLLNANGSQRPPFFAAGSGNVSIYGTGFTTPTFVANGSGVPNVWGTYWQLGGTLSDGSPLTTVYWNVSETTEPTGVNFVLIQSPPAAPEPGSLALVLLGVLTTGARLRRRSR